MDNKIIESFQLAWQNTFLNQSEVLSNSELINNLKEFLDKGETARKEQVNKLVNEFKFLKSKEKLAVNSIVSTNGMEYTENGKVYKLNVANGIPTLVEMTGGTNLKADSPAISIISDEVDSADYYQRYSSIDAVRYKDDGSNIAFLRIIENKVSPDGTRKVIFPNFEKSLAPGITKNKFKQFIITQSSISHQERMQIVETNKEFQVLFFGKKAEVLQIAGVLKNTIDNPWSVNMIFLWDGLMRGTELVANGCICQLFIDGELFEGYPFSFNRSKIAGNDNIVQFNFSFLVKERVIVEGQSSTDIIKA